MQCNDVRNYFADYVKEQVPESVQVDLVRHLKECSMCADELDGLTDVWIRLGTIPALESPVAAMNSRFKDVLGVLKEDLRPAPRKATWVIAGVVAASIALVFLWSTVSLRRPLDVASAIVEAADGQLYKTAGGTRDLLKLGSRINLGEQIRAERGAMLVLTDGSHVEMRSGSQIALESATDGVRIRLDNGSVLVTAAKQHSGHLYVQTKDMTVAVVGTVFLVNAEEAGSRVAVIEGEVSVKQGANAQSLLPGEQVATVPAMLPVQVSEEISWSRNASEHVAMLVQLQKAAAPQIAEIKPAIPEFEVAAIHPSGLNSTSWKFDDKNERVTMENMSLRTIIRFAYNVRNFQIAGPDSLNTERYTIQAKAPAGTPNEQLRPMLQPLLEKRFKMAVRREMKETPVYALIVATPGKLKEFSPGEALSGRGGLAGIAGGLTGVSTFRNLGPMSGFVDSLSDSLPLPVVDRTGLTGRYEINLRYVPETIRERGESAGPSIFEALADYGLKLEKVRASIEFLVIEHIEKPSEN